MTDEYVTKQDLKEVLSGLLKMVTDNIVGMEKRFNDKLEKQALMIGSMEDRFNTKLAGMEKRFDDKLEKQALMIGNNVSKAIAETSKISDERIMKFEKEQTDRLLKVLDKYEKKTEKHERTFNKMKDELTEDE